MSATVIALRPALNSTKATPNNEMVPLFLRLAAEAARGQYLEVVALTAMHDGSIARHQAGDCSRRALPL